jgi:hypothetical protein
MSRIWRFPDLRNGFTLHHITDTHFGAANHGQFVLDWQEATAQDMEWLRVSLNAGHVHTGDMIHSYDGASNSSASRNAELGWYKSWRDKITADGLPYAEAFGNHDLIGPGIDGARTPVTSAQFAASLGLDAPNNAVDMGAFKVLTVAPDVWADNTDFVLSAGTLDWLDTELQAAGKPCWIAAHVPWNEQMGTSSGGSTSVEPGNPGLVDLIDSNPNAIGWLSGHRHANIRTNASHASAFTVGSRRIFGVNGPAAGGGRNSAVSFEQHRWKGGNESMFVTYLGDAIDVRWRDHNRRSWINPPGETVRHITL